MSAAPPRWTRRAAITAGAVLLGGGLLFALRTGDRGGPHLAYFQQLGSALKRAGVAQPVMVIDRQRLDANIHALKSTLSGQRLALRVVVKSLPAAGLIQYIAERADTTRYMAFNGPMLAELVQRTPQADVLLGKPLPVKAAEQFYQAVLGSQLGTAEPQWLVDTALRLAQYAALARRLNRRLRVNFEIDVGLHRGGFTTPAALRAALETASREGLLEVSGLMGYDPHVPKMPSVQRAYRASQEAYRGAIEVLRAVFPGRTHTLNAAGSPTYVLHAQGTVANEVSVGSAFVKPTDFDTDLLAKHVPAAFIATPVIKAIRSAQMPGLEALTSVRHQLDRNTERGFFIHGGHWLAKPESPPGLQYSDLYGRSSNQELLNGSASVELRPDDFVFLRPTQSEAVLLQFGDLLIYDGQDIVGRWPTFPVSA